MFAGIHAGVVEIPDFRALVLGIPLPEPVTEAEEAFLGAGFFLVAPSAADTAVKTKFLNRPQQHRRLQAIPADLPGRHVRQSFLDGVLDGADDQLRAELLRAPVAEFDQLRKLVARLNVEERHRQVARAERFFREAQEADGILAAGKEQRRALKFPGDFTHDVNRLGFQILQMIQMIRTHEKESGSGFLGLGAWNVHRSPHERIKPVLSLPDWVQS